MRLRSVSDKQVILCLLVLSLVLTLFNTSQSIHCGQNTGCVDSYWANFWLISYSDGYERRALVGQIMRIAFGHSVSFIALNVIAFLFASLCLVLLYKTFFSRIIDNDQWIVFFVVLVSGPMTTVFFEVLGDPLHVAFFCVLCYLFAVPRMNSKLVQGVTTVATGIIVTLIHEASVFLFFPSIYLGFCISVGLKPGFKFILIVICLFVLMSALVFNKQEPHSAGLALLAKDSTLYFPPKEILPSLTDLLMFELRSYFGSLRGIFKFTYKLAGSFFIPVILLLVSVHVLRISSAVRTFVYLLIPSLPLYVIAHDWGRFSVYILALTFMLCGKFGDELRFFNLGIMGYLSDKIVSVTKPLFEKLTLLILLVPIFHAHPSYRINGLTPQALVLAAATLIIYLFIEYSYRTRFTVGKQKQHY